MNIILNFKKKFYVYASNKAEGFQGVGSWLTRIVAEFWNI